MGLMNPPSSRPKRKESEYKMAVIRTIFNVIGGLAALVGLMVSLLIYHRVYFNGGG